MSRIRDFFKNPKPILYSLLLVLLVLLIGGSFFWVRIWLLKGDAEKAKTIGDITTFDSKITVTPGDVISQSYPLDGIDYQKFGMYIKFTPDNDNGHIFVKAAYGAKEFSFKLGKNDINDSGYTYLEFPQDLPQKTASRLSIELSTDNPKGFVIYTNEEIKVADSQTVLNGNTINKKIVIELRTDKEQKDYSIYYKFLIVSILFLTFFAFLIHKKGISVAAVTSVALLFLGISYMLVFTANTVPDEPLHYRTAYHVSNKMLFNFKDEQKGLYMRTEDFNYYCDAKQELTTKEYDHASNYSNLFCKEENKKVIKAYRTYMENRDLVYIFPAFGITLGRLIGFSAYWTYQLGRFVNFLVFVISVYFAIKMMPFGKMAISAISLLPMTLHIMASNSYDVFTMSGLLLIFAYTMKLMYSEQKIGWRQLLLLGILIFLVIPQKIVYIGVAALVLLLPKNNFKTPKLHFVYKCLLGAVAIIGIFFFQFLSFSKLGADTVTNSTDMGYTLPYVLTHIRETASLMINTVYETTDFYLKSLLAYFGFFQLEMPWFLALPILIILLVSFLRKENEPKALKDLPKAYVLLLSLFVFAAVELILLIDHTFMGSKVIMGVQGRYFIPALPLVFLVVRNNAITIKQDIDNRLVFAACATNIVILFNVLISVLG